MVSIGGDWDVVIKTPIGSLHVLYRFEEDIDVVTGSAASKQETEPLNDIFITEESGTQRVRWRQTVTKPMRLKLDFEVTVDGDRFSGHSRARPVATYGRLRRASEVHARIVTDEVTTARLGPPGGRQSSSCTADFTHSSDYDRSMRSVAVLALPDVIAYDIAIAVEVFGRVILPIVEDGYRVFVCGTEPLVQAGPLRIGTTDGLAALEGADIVVVPG